MKTKRQIACMMIFSVYLMVTSGCASYATRAMSPGQARYYPGMRSDAGMIAHPSRVTWAAPYKTERVVFGTVDIVPSTIVDTLLLPLELTMSSSTNSPDTVAAQTEK